MFEDIEEKILNEKEAYTEIPIPEQIDHFIAAGIEKAKKRKTRASFRRITILAAIFTVITTTTLMLTTPASASYLKNIPGIGYLYKVFYGDKGLTDALDHNIVQHVNVSDTHNGITFSLDHIVADGSTLAGFFSLHIDKGVKLYLDNLDILDTQGKTLNAGIATGTLAYDDTNLTAPYIARGRFDIAMGQGDNIPDAFQCKVNLSTSEQRTEEPNGKGLKNETRLPYTWHLQIKVDQKTFAVKEKVYPINQTIVMEGQKITFEKVTISPVKSIIEVSFDAANTKQIFGFTNLRLVDEKNEVWATIPNSITSFTGTDKHTYFMQSSYFSSPKKLFIKADSVRALDKDKLVVKVDLDKHKIINPPDERLALDKSPWDTPKKSIYFKIKYDSPKEIPLWLFDSEFKDASGKVHRNDGAGASNGTFEYFIPKGVKFKSPIELKISDYPAKIYEEVSVEVY